jgi:D-sedoheptulose 7-phosphate isomerase
MLNSSDNHPMTKYGGQLIKNIERSVTAKQEFISNVNKLEDFDRAVELVVACYRRGRRLYIAGNGGSAADSQHLAAEFVSRLARTRAPLPAEALTVDTSALTAIGNDFGFEEVFARQIQAKMQPGDVFFAITTSGQSKNILRALEECRKRDCKSILLTGRDGGAARELADYLLLATGEDTSTIQEVHMVLYHTLCACVEAELFPI